MTEPGEVCALGLLCRCAVGLRERGLLDDLTVRRGFNASSKSAAVCYCGIASWEMRSAMTSN
jgi:hypothetical protein